MISLNRFRKLLIGSYRYEETVEDLRKRGVKIGDDVHIYSSEIDTGHGFLIEIGSHVTITNATILSHDASTKKFLGYSKVGKVKIGDEVFIGYGSIILPGVHIGNRVIIGAGAVVRTDVPDDSVVMGNPAQIVCSTQEYIRKNREKMEQVPVYTTYWKDKTEEEKIKMSEELEKQRVGFDL